ncbi:histidine triad nucleotide-binding protein [candidate division KSB1 bacterium]|nr:histidine triad nucleotide-binding protein [candidate division KSB1 bacterium]
MVDCLFCKIINKEINSDILFEDDDVLAFKDINPQAPIHFLIVPKKHISTINDLQQEDEKLTGKMILTAQSLAKQENIDENGYRLVFNCNSDGGQEVYHIHLHLLGGRRMQWPPG